MRDTTALLRAVAPDIKSSFGGDGGVQGFRDHWRLSSPDTEIWAVLTDWHSQLQGGSIVLIYPDRQADGGMTVRHLGAPPRPAKSSEIIE